MLQRGDAIGTTLRVDRGAQSAKDMRAHAEHGHEKIEEGDRKVALFLFAGANPTQSVEHDAPGARRSPFF